MGFSSGAFATVAVDNSTIKQGVGGSLSVTNGGRPAVTVIVSPNGGDIYGEYGANTSGTKTGGIQEAINAVASSGGTVFIKNGTYTCSQVYVNRAISGHNISYLLSIPSNVIVKGESRAGVIIKAGNGLNAGSVLVADGLGVGTANDFEVCNFTIDGNRANQTDNGYDGDQAGIYINQCNRFHVHDITVKNAVAEGIYDSLNGQDQWDSIATQNCGGEGFAASACGYGHHHQILSNGDCQATSSGQRGYKRGGLDYSGDLVGAKFDSNISISSGYYGVNFLSDGGTFDMQNAEFGAIYSYNAGVLGACMGTTDAGSGAEGIHIGLLAIANCPNNSGFLIYEARNLTIDHLRIYNVNGYALGFAPTASNYLQDVVINYFEAFDNQGVHTTTYPIQDSSAATILGTKSVRINGGDFSQGGFTSSAVPYLPQGNAGFTFSHILGYTPVAPSSITASTSPYTMPALPYDTIYMLKTANGISALTLDSQNISMTTLIPILVKAGHTLIVTWSSSAPVFEAIPQ